MSFAGSIAKAYRSVIPLSWIYLGNDLVVALFAVLDDSIRVKVEFQQEHVGLFNIRFSVDQDLPKDRLSAAFTIFNGVFQAVEEFLLVREPQRVLFSTKHDDLADIYTAYLEREKDRIAELGYRVLAPNYVAGFVEYGLELSRMSRWKEL